MMRINNVGSGNTLPVFVDAAGVIASAGQYHISPVKGRRRLLGRAFMAGKKVVNVGTTSGKFSFVIG